MSATDYVCEVDAGSFQDKVLDASKRVPVLVDFWASWCAPCRMLAPVLDKLANAYQGKFLVAKVNTDEQRQLAEQYAIRSLPTVKVFRNGRAVDEFLGAQPESAVRAVIDRHVARDSDRLRARSAELRSQGDLAGAAQILRQAMADDPGNDRTHIDLANLLMEQGAYEDARRVLKSLPDARQLEPDITGMLAKLRFAQLAENAPAAAVLEDRIATQPGDCEARYQLSAVKALAGDYEAAMEQLLEILRRDRGFRDDAGRRGLVDLFDLLGNDPLVSKYRSLMAKALY